MDSAQNELARAIEAGDAAAQVEANKKLLHYQLMQLD